MTAPAGIRSPRLSVLSGTRAGRERAARGVNRAALSASGLRRTRDAPRSTRSNCLAAQPGRHSTCVPRFQRRTQVLRCADQRSLVR